jgi:hypothetical protein
MILTPINWFWGPRCSGHSWKVLRSNNDSKRVEIELLVIMMMMFFWVWHHVGLLATKPIISSSSPL